MSLCRKDVGALEVRILLSRHYGRCVGQQQVKRCKEKWPRESRGGGEMPGHNLRSLKQDTLPKMEGQ